MKQWNFVVCVLLGCLLDVCQLQNVKTWKFNTNFLNAENWERRKVPCKTSVAVFPAYSSVPVELPFNFKMTRLLELRKLILSRQGSLIFPRSGGFSLSDEERHATCSGGEDKFIRADAKQWTDPDNWQRFSNEATPHLERLPCSYDDVIFPNGSTFFVSLPGRPIVVSSVSVHGRVYRSEEPWNEFLTSDVGFKAFSGGNRIQVTGEGCRDSAGCECGNSHLREAVCAGKWKWREAQCANPVTPIGFCFPLCGAFLLYTDGAIKDIADAVTAFAKTSDVIAYTSKTNGFIQIVLLDANEYTGSIIDVASELNELLVTRGLVKEKMTSIHSSGLKVIHVDSTLFVEHFFFGLVCACIGFAIIFCTYEKNWWSGKNRMRIQSLWPRPSEQPFSFAKFENTTGVVEIGSTPVTTGGDELMQEVDHGKGFDNPMYDQSSELGDHLQLSELKRSRGSNNSVDTDSESSVGTDSTTHDQLSLKEVPLEPLVASVGSVSNEMKLMK